MHFFSHVFSPLLCGFSVWVYVSSFHTNDHQRWQDGRVVWLVKTVPCWNESFFSTGWNGPRRVGWPTNSFSFFLFNECVIAFSFLSHYVINSDKTSCLKCLPLIRELHVLSCELIFLSDNTKKKPYSFASCILSL